MNLIKCDELWSKLEGSFDSLELSGRRQVQKTTFGISEAINKGLLQNNKQVTWLEIAFWCVFLDFSNQYLFYS